MGGKNKVRVASPKVYPFTLIWPFKWKRLKCLYTYYTYMKLKCQNGKKKKKKKKKKKQTNKKEAVGDIMKETSKTVHLAMFLDLFYGTQVFSAFSLCFYVQFTKLLHIKHMYCCLHSLLVPAPFCFFFIFPVSV